MLSRSSYCQVVLSISKLECY
ncbi:hypothetical protein RHECNPAF_122100155 [Rhizobium etli CNPAF512]|nr:hypothetical protein RHECNPAF_122100155 [Rhizobium etli CNPAF512]